MNEFIVVLVLGMLAAYIAGCFVGTPWPSSKEALLADELYRLKQNLCDVSNELRGERSENRVNLRHAQDRAELLRTIHNMTAFAEDEPG